MKDENYKLSVQIESLYGTSLWLFHAGTRANNIVLKKAATKVFSPLFNINGNINYSQIVAYDEYLVKKCKKEAPPLASNLQKNEGINLTNHPFAAQSNDALHEQFNKLGQNMYAGKSVEDFKRAFKTVDDVYEMRSKITEYTDLTDRMDIFQAKIPNYEPLITKIRKGIRKSNLYSSRLEKTELKSMSGDELNPNLSNIYRHSVEIKDSDIRRFIRHNDITKAYKASNRITILKDNMKKEKNT